MLHHRPRRNRKNSALRALVQETRLAPSDLIVPHFVLEGTGIEQEIKSMPGIYRHSVDKLLKVIERQAKQGIRAVALFPVIPSEMKDMGGTQALNPVGILLQTIRAIKKEFPELCLISDVALDPYTSHGHDGLINQDGIVKNDESVELLVKMALLQAEAGVDLVAPSDMMDGRIGAIRQALEEKGLTEVGILAYAAKYASAFYGPFRDALGSHLQFGDKKSYQLNPANRREALIESALDAAEGADILMVKPALPYLDVLLKLREETSLPLAAYQVSGEYSMIMAADKEGWLDGKKALYESLLGIKRAGADMILTYAAEQIAVELNSGVHD